MGIEYSLRFQAPTKEAVVTELLRLSGASTSSNEPLVVKFGLTSRTTDEWPAATGHVESGGVLFCNHSGLEGRNYLGSVVAKLAGAFGPIEVEEL